MCSKHEMVCTSSSIPEGVFSHHNLHIILKCANERAKIMRKAVVSIFNHISNTDGQEVCVGMIQVPRPAPRLVRLEHLKLLDEPTFNGVDVLAGPTVHDWRFSFLIYIHLESLLHLSIAPTRYCATPFQLLNTQRKWRTKTHKSMSDNNKIIIQKAKDVNALGVRAINPTRSRNLLLILVDLASSF